MDRNATHCPWFALLITIMTGGSYADNFDPATQPPGFIAPVALSSTNITAGATLFQPWFDAACGCGDLLAFALDPRGGGTGALRWSAASRLQARDWRERLIITRRDDTGEGVAFRTIGALSPAQQSALGDQARLDYMRGDASLEGTRFRSRSHRTADDRPVRNILGALLHGNPVYVDHGASASLYVGANDGMRHSFDATSGDELFAYIPAMIYSRLAAVAEPAAAPYTVDGGLAVATVTFHDGSTHKLLVGSLGAGGQGLYALDIGDARPHTEADAARKVLWEFSDHDEPALGYTYGTPQLVRLGDWRWAALIGNGYANTADDGRRGTGSAQLLIIDAETGGLIRRIDTYSGATTDGNGLSTPRAIDSDGDGRIDYVYAGDLYGQLWRFDLRSRRSSEWTVSFNGAPLYSARDFTRQPQAITTAPAIVAHPDSGVRIVFGTGRLLSTHDLDPVSSAQNNAIYGVHDSLSTTPPDTADTLQQTLSEQRTAENRRVLALTRTSGDHAIWRVDLASGERVLTDPLFDEGRVSVTLARTLSTPPEVWLLELDAQSGGSPQQLVFDMNDDGALDARDTLTPNSAHPAAADFIAGRQYGDGIGSGPVFANLSATRRVTYINRNSAATHSGSTCTADCADTPLDTDSDTRLESAADTATTTDDRVIEDASTLLTAAAPCGTADCVAEARRNPGRVIWKELLAE